MWREWIAKSTATGEELHFVVIEDTSPTLDASDLPVQLVVNRHHLCAKREVVLDREFRTIEEAKDYCTRQFGVPLVDWQDQVTFPYVFQFDFAVSNTGVPQPQPVGFADSKIVFRHTEREDLCTGAKRLALNICGNPEGLKQLAAMLLLCADSANYDEWFHIHLEDQKEFDGDIEVTLRAPSYLESISNGTFQDGTG